MVNSCTSDNPLNNSAAGSRFCWSGTKIVSWSCSQFLTCLPVQLLLLTFNSCLKISRRLALRKLVLKFLRSSLTSHSVRPSPPHFHTFSLPLSCTTVFCFPPFSPYFQIFASNQRHLSRLPSWVPFSRGKSIAFVQKTWQGQFYPEPIQLLIVNVLPVSLYSSYLFFLSFNASKM